MIKKLFNIFKYTMLVTIIIISVLCAITFLYMRQSQFGQAPDEARVEMLKRSPHFKDGKFQNIHHTPELTEGHSMSGVMYDYFFNKSKRSRPVDSIPSMKTDLLALSSKENVLVWFGHSSYFIQLDGKRFLVDPVFSGNASPIPGSVTSFAGTDRYTVADLPNIDYLIISHDHYDHVDYETLIDLKAKTGKVICGLGVGAHFEYWGYGKDQIIEKDWYEDVNLDSGFVVHTAPARHFSGRGFTRNNTLWMSYLLQTPSMKIYIGGDSGYDTHFAEVGEKFGPVDLAILDNGQYDLAWRYIHTLPEEVLVAAKDLKAKRLFPVHSSKFVLANHAWDEPLEKITQLNQSVIPLVTPLIGEKVNLNDDQQKFSKWWVGIK